jgi:drug/metabolite transporter (DMT)-like permease
MALASLQFGVVVVVGKVSTRTGLPIPTTLAVRYTIAAAILAVALAVARQPLAAAPGERLGLVVLGVAGYAVESGFFFAALDHGAASAVTLLFFTYPVFVALGSMAMGRGAPGWLLGGALVSTVSGAGLVVASTGGLSIEPLGVVFALASALTFSGYLLGADAVLKKTRSLTSSMWVSAAAAGGLAAFALLFGEAAVPRGMDQWGPPSAMGLATAGAFVCLLTGLRLLGPVRAAIIASTEPVAGSVLAFVFLDEPVRAGMVAGGVLILAGAVAASLARPAPPAEPPVP